MGRSEFRVSLRGLLLMNKRYSMQRVHRTHLLNKVIYHIILLLKRENENA